MIGNLTDKREVEIHVAKLGWPEDARDAVNDLIQEVHGLRMEIRKSPHFTGDEQIQELKKQTAAASLELLTCQNRVLELESALKKQAETQTAIISALQIEVDTLNQAQERFRTMAQEAEDAKAVAVAELEHVREDAHKERKVNADLLAHSQERTSLLDGQLKEAQGLLINKDAEIAKAMSDCLDLGLAKKAEMTMYIEGLLYRLRAAQAFITTVQTVSEQTYRMMDKVRDLAIQAQSHNFNIDKATAQETPSEG